MVSHSRLFRYCNGRKPRHDLKKQEGFVARECRLLGEFGGIAGEEIKDPFYMTQSAFDETFEQIERCVQGLLRYIENGTWQAPKGRPSTQFTTSLF